MNSNTTTIAVSTTKSMTICGPYTIHYTIDSESKSDGELTITFKEQDKLKVIESPAFAWVCLQ